MKLWKKIVLWIILFFLVSVIALAVWQFDNIMVLVKTFSTSSADIAREIDSEKKQLEQELKEQYPSVVSDFSAEEEKKIIKGELSVEEAVSYLNEKFENIKQKEEGKTEKPVQNNSKTKEEVDALIGEKAIELYSLKAYYLGKLGQMEASVKKDYASMPKEKKNLIGKKELVSKYMGTAMNLLSQCDARVEELLAELKAELNKLGADTSIIKKIRDAYESEKNLKKAYYIKLLEE